MTRVNVIEPSLLTDQHLFAEYREITRIFALVKNAQDKHGIQKTLQKIPPSFVMGTGHVLFFYDKLDFIEKRYHKLKDCVLQRGFDITLKDSIIDFRTQIAPIFYQDYMPNCVDIEKNCTRLIEKIRQRPNWYRLHGDVIDDNAYIARLQTLWR